MNRKPPTSRHSQEGDPVFIFCTYYCVTPALFAALHCPRPKQLPSSRIPNNDQAIPQVVTPLVPSSALLPGATSRAAEGWPSGVQQLGRAYHRASRPFSSARVERLPKRSHHGRRDGFSCLSDSAEASDEFTPRWHQKLKEQEVSSEEGNSATGRHGYCTETVIASSGPISLHGPAALQARSAGSTPSVPEHEEQELTGEDVERDAEEENEADDEACGADDERDDQEEW